MNRRTSRHVLVPVFAAMNARTMLAIACMAIASNVAPAAGAVPPKAGKTPDSTEQAKETADPLKYHAFQLGVVTCRTLHSKAAGNHPDDDGIKQLRQRYHQVGLKDEFANASLLDKNCTYQELAQVLLGECCREIESRLGKRGLAAKYSFMLGVHMQIVDHLLRVDMGDLSPETRKDIEGYLNETLPENAKAAGCSKEFLEFLRDVLRTVDSEDVPTKSRRKWADMIAALNDKEKAMKIMNGNEGSKR